MVRRETYPGLKSDGNLGPRQMIVVQLFPLLGIIVAFVNATLTKGKRIF